MIIRYPLCYDRFRCIGAQCPDSCCKDWAVQIDADTAAFYRNLPGPLGDALRNSLQQEDGDTILALRPDGRCPMWRDDGLCRIHAQLGEDALCHTCRQFPRLRHDYGSFVELGLELSCPEAARLIFQEGLTLTEQTVPGEPEPDCDEELMNILLESRQQALAFLESKAFSPGESLALLLLYGYRVQNQIDGGEAAYMDPQADLDAVRGMAAQADLQQLLDFFSGLEILTPLWRQRLASPTPSRWQELHRTLAIYFVQRYWLQAVADYDLVSRVKLVLVSCLMVRALGGDPVSTAQLYSKEIENDADNVDALLDAAYTCSAMVDVKLLGWLLEDGL